MDGSNTEKDKALNINIDQQHPYPGLFSFREEDNDYFFGRKKEIKDLTGLIEGNLLTVIYGKSGVGKTSLLRAGLMPKLKSNYFLPIYLRINFHDPDKPPIKQVKDTIESTIKQLQPNTKPFEDTTLWEFFAFTEILNGYVTPLLLFDQFEEVFTVGKNNPDHLDVLVTELADLIENHVPATVRKRFEEEKKTIPFKSGDRKLKIIISLREDHIPQLDSLNRYIPSLKFNRSHISRMRGKDAVDTIMEPGKEIIKDPEVGKEIIEKIPAAKGGGGYTPFENAVASWETKEIEPFLLNLYCYHINQKRLEEDAPEISQELVRSINTDNIVKDYYEENISQFEAHVKNSVENLLLTDDGYRKLQDIDSFKAGYGITDEEVNRLMGMRIIQKEILLGFEYVELAHDVLVPVLTDCRENRKALEEKNKIWEQRIKEAVEQAVGETAEAAEKAAQKKAEDAAKAVEEAAKKAAEEAARKAEDAVKATKDAADEAAKEAAKKAADEAAREVEDAVRATKNTAEIAAAEAAKEAARAVEDAVKVTKDAAEITTKKAVEKAIKEAEESAAQKAAEEAAVRKKRNHRLIAAAAALLILIFIGTAAVVLDQKAKRNASDESAKREKIRADQQTEKARDEEWKGRAYERAAYSIDALKSDAFDLSFRLAKSACKENKHNPAALRALLSVFYESDIHKKVLKEKGVEFAKTVSKKADFFAAFSPDGKYILTVTSKDTRLWNIDFSPIEGKRLRLTGDTEFNSDAAFSPDGKIVVFPSKSNRSVIVWDIDKGKNTLLELEEAVGSITFPHRPGADLPEINNGTIFAAGGAKDLYLFDLTGKIIKTLKGHTDDVNALAFSYDGRTIATAGRDKTVRQWDLNGKPQGKIFPLDHDGVKTLAFSPDSQSILTAGSDGSVHLWDLPGNRKKRTLQPHTQAVTSAVFSPDGNYILTGSKDKTVRLSTQTNFLVIKFKSFPGVIRSVSFSPDGKYILIAPERGPADVLLIDPGDIIDRVDRSGIIKPLTRAQEETYNIVKPNRR